jgi:hypothetical protein
MVIENGGILHRFFNFNINFSFIDHCLINVICRFNHYFILALKKLCSLKFVAEFMAHRYILLNLIIWFTYSKTQFWHAIVLRESLYGFLSVFERSEIFVDQRLWLFIRLDLLVSNIEKMAQMVHF